MLVNWLINDIEVNVTVSNIQWDNDSIGMSEYWGFLKDDARDDYIADFEVDEVNIISSPIDDQLHDMILDYEFAKDEDFIAVLEDKLNYE